MQCFATKMIARLYSRLLLWWLGATWILGFVLCAPVRSQQGADKDPVLEAMKAELERSRVLRIGSVEPPYFIQYRLFDVSRFSAASSLGALLLSNSSRSRYAEVEVRLGSYESDNSNYAHLGRRTPFAARLYGVPVEDDAYALRHQLWLGTDTAFKIAAEVMALKQAALRQQQAREKLPDFARAPAITMVKPRAPSLSVNEEKWTDLIRKLSAIFLHFPGLQDSVVQFRQIQTTMYLVNSEGTVIRTPEALLTLEIRAQTQADDGSELYYHDEIYRRTAEHFPDPLTLQNRAREVAEKLTLLQTAPPGETYVGPVLFDGVAGAQFFAQLVGLNLAFELQPVTPPDTRIDVRESPLQGRLGRQIMPDWFDVIDDPTLATWQGEPLLGSYEVDLEGVRAETVKVVEAGIFKMPLLTRQPVETFVESNGHARLPDPDGGYRASISNLIIQARKTVPYEELKKLLIDEVKRQGLDYGFIVRKLDFPSAAPFQLLRSWFGNRGPGSGLMLSPPLEIYKVDVDGRETLVRGLRFEAVSIRSLNDITAASDKSFVFHFLNNTAPLARLDAASFVAESSVVAPAILVREMELRPMELDRPALPVVPSPLLSLTLPAQ